MSLPRPVHVVALMLLAVPVTASPATATPVVWTANGTLSPGLSYCAYQTIHFSGSFVGSPPGVAVGNFDYTGSSAMCEDVISGRGSGFFTGDLTGPANYARTGNSMTFVGPGHAYLCVFTPTNVNPVTSFHLACGPWTTANR